MSAERPLSRVLARLEALDCRPLGRSGSWQAFCPGHDDGRRRGLSIREVEGGRVLVYCHHGRPSEEILAALGLSWADLFPPGEQRRNGSDQKQHQGRKADDPLAWWAERCGVPLSWLKTLPLEARDGAVAFTWPGLKTAKLRAPGGKGWWEPEDTPRPPLWPALPEAAVLALVLLEGESDATIAAYIVEALGLQDRAFAAAATKGAAARPDAALLRELVAKGFRALLLVPDADEAGQKWAQAWTEAARQAGLVTQVFDLVNKGLVAPSLGEKDLRDAYRRQSVKIMAGLRGAIEGLVESVPSSKEREHSGTEIGGARWPVLAIGEALEGPEVAWVWQGFVGRGLFSDLYGLWKSGKSTLVGCLLRQMATGGELVGRPVAQGRALVITEETASKWARRAQEMGIPSGSHDLIARPFKKRPTWEEWELFVEHVAALVRERGYSLVAFDALPNLWPVSKENEAGEVLTALRPLVAIAEAGAGVLLVRHPRKSDGDEATAGRGSGAIGGFVDIIIEFRRYRPEDGEDRRRVLSVYSREEPVELVAEWDGSTYIALGGKAEVRREERLAALLSALPTEPPGLTYEQVREAWPVEPKPGIATVKADLARLLEQGEVVREGRGVSGDPFRWRRKSVPLCSSSLEDGTDLALSLPVKSGPPSSSSLEDGTDFPAQQSGRLPAWAIEELRRAGFEPEEEGA
jgi:hypothetical protein